MRRAELAGTPRVYQNTMNRDHLERGRAAFAEQAAAAGVELDGLDDSEDWGKPESAITAAVDVTAYLEYKRRAMRAHASQISESSFFLAMPDEAFRYGFGTEWFIRDGQGPGHHRDGPARRACEPRGHGRAVTASRAVTGAGRITRSAPAARAGRSAAQPGAGHARERGRPGDGAEPVRGGLQRLVLVVAQLDLGRGDVAFQLLDAGCARDRDHGGPVDDPGERDLRRGGGVRVGHLAQGPDQVTGAVEVVRRETAG